MGVIRPWIPLWLLISVRRFPGLPLHSCAEGSPWAARASGHSSRARVHRCSCSLSPLCCPRCFLRFTKHRPILWSRSPGHPRRLPQVPRLWRLPARPHLRPRPRPRPRHHPPRHPRRRPRPLLRRRLLESISARSGLRLSLVSQSGHAQAEMLTGRVEPSSIRQPRWSWLEGGSFVRVLVAGAHGKTARRLADAGRRWPRDRGTRPQEEQTGDVEADGAEPVVVDLEAEEVGGGSGGRSRVHALRRRRR